MNTQARAGIARQAAQAVCLGILLSITPMAQASQHGGGSVPRSTPRPQPQSVPRYQPPPPHFGGFSQPRPQQPAQAQRPAPAPAQGQNRPAPRSPYAVRPNPQAAGHLPQWMSQHQNLPVGQQERLLRQEPGFNRLAPADQQRQIQELHRLNQMPEAQRDRRLARNEAFERLSPGEQMQVRQSSGRLATLPPDRQTMVRRAFQDLRGVPVEQRETMLNSARYNATFSPEERGILSNLLRVEPYQGLR